MSQQACIFLTFASLYTNETEICSYGRIILRIENMYLPEKSIARRILSWLACTKAPLQERELMQALMVQEGDDDLVAERRILQDIRRLCGPIIEVDGEIVSFVHSTARK